MGMWGNGVGEDGRLGGEFGNNVWLLGAWWEGGFDADVAQWSDWSTHGHSSLLYYMYIVLSNCRRC